MNRTDRLYALVEELRACAPRRRSARELASLYEVSARTIERDIGALQQAGVPIYADAGRSGGYTVDKSLTLPPLNFTPAEAVAVAVALAQVNVGPFEGAARSAVRKIVAAMSGPNVTAARDLAGRVRLLEPVVAPETVPVPSVIEQAIVARRVLWICYLDRDGNLTERDVEPIVFMAGRQRLVSGRLVPGPRCRPVLPRRPDPAGRGHRRDGRAARLRGDRALRPRPRRPHPRPVAHVAQGASCGRVPGMRGNTDRGVSRGGPMLGVARIETTVEER